MTTEILADFNVWTFKGYGYARGHDGNKSEVDVVPYKMYRIIVYLINYVSHLILKSSKIFPTNIALLQLPTL